MSKRKSLKQILAIILILTVLTTEIPLEVLGMERDEFDFLQNSEISMEETVKDVEEAKKPHIIAEKASNDGKAPKKRLLTHITQKGKLQELRIKKTMM